MNLLVVEDSAQQPCPVAAELRALGHSVDVAADGAQALARAAERRYDIIILDLTLPKESSLLVLHEIRESDHEVAILILAARDQIHDRITALIQGADDYLVEPFTRARLQQRIRQLRRHRDASAASRAGPRTAPEKNDHSNRLIAELLEQCRCGPGEIELVISEVKPAQLLQRVSEKLRWKSDQRNVRLRVPGALQPVMLVDARWMQRLLTILVDNAIELSPPGGSVEIGLQPQQDYCRITIENSLTLPLAYAARESVGRRGLHGRSGHASDRSLGSLKLANRHAACMNLELQVRLSAVGRLRARVGKIKIV